MDSSGDDPTAAALAWLLSSDESGVRYLTRRELLDDRDGEAAAADAAQLLEGPKTRALLAGQQPDGDFGVHPYSKWTGAHWRLVSLVELAAPAGEPRLQAAASTVLDWLTSRSHRRRLQVIDGLTRRCASQEGNALAVACRLGMAGDPRAELLARSLVAWQWPDGGWNCDLRASGRRSSFHESLPPAWACTSTGGRPALAGPALPALLALRRAAGAADPVAARQGRRPPRRRRAGAADAAPPRRRPLAAGRVLVAPTRHRPGVEPGRGGRLGAVGPQRDAHPQRAAGAQGRWLIAGERTPPCERSLCRR